MPKRNINYKKSKLNLGSGFDKKPGWINIDALPMFKPDLVHDLTDPLPFSDNSVAEVLAQDILEHFTKEDVANIIAEIARVLKKGGMVTVRVPNVDDIVHRFKDDKETRNEFLYGTTKQTGVFGAHKMGFTPRLLIFLMMKHQLELVSLKQETTNYLAVFKKVSHQHRLKKILYINQSLSMGGAEEFMSDLLQALVDSKKVRVVAYASHSPFLKLLRAKGISSVYKLPVIVDIIGDWKGLIKAPIALPRALWHYYFILKKHRNAQVLLLSGFMEKIIAGVLLKLLNFRFATTWVEFGPLHTLLDKFMKLPRFLYYSVKDVSEKIIVPTRHTKQHLIAGAKLSLSKLTVIPCGRRILAPRTTKVDEYRLVCVSRLERGKGQDLVIQAFGKVKQKIPQATLHIVGEGDREFERELRLLISKLGLHESVVLTGRVKSALAELKKAAVCVFPSMWNLEGFGLVAIEAMAVGRPVVAFDHAPLNEIITHRQEGLLVKSGDLEGLAQSIIKLLKDKKLQQKLGAQGKKTFKTKYKIGPVANLYWRELKNTMWWHKAGLLESDLDF